MAVRTTSELVAGIIEVDESISLDPFISAASSLVDRVRDANLSEEALAQTDPDDPDLDALLEQIETWLAAHFYAIRDPRATREQAGTVGASYESKVDLGLNLTRYGQQAMILDATGTLRTLNSATTSRRRQASVTWMGTEDE